MPMPTTTRHQCRDAGRSPDPVRGRRHAGHRAEEVQQPVAEDEEAASADRADGQHDHRSRHHRRRLVRVHLVVPAALAGEGHEHDPGHVERGDASADQGRGTEQRPGSAALGERGVDDRVLGEEAGQRRDADDRQVAEPEGDGRDRHDPGQAAEAAHVDLVVHLVLDRPGPEEHPGLEEAVREQVRDREHVPGRAEAGGEHHVADLAHRRSGQRLLDVVLGAPDDRAEQQRDGADDGDGEPRARRQVEDRRRPDDQVHAGGHHRRRVDQGRHGGRAFHRVQQPGLQRHLGRLAARAEQQQQADGE